MEKRDIQKKRIEQNEVIFIHDYFKNNSLLVIPKATPPQYIEKDDRLFPQWAIAVIVIGVGGLLFIIIFGVSVVSIKLQKHTLKILI